MTNDILQLVLTRNPDKPLYHYTNQTGFMGIIHSQEIWATHTQYLNDQREFLHAISLVRDIVKEHQASCTNDAEHNVLEDMRDGIDGNESINICVSSFSSVPDSLSQWRAYSGGGSGFSMGFAGSFLKEVADAHDFYLAPCIYDRRQQMALLNALVDDALTKNINLKETGEYDDYPAGGVLPANLNVYAPIIKDEAFKEEEEWRLISRPLSCRNNRFSFREGPSMLIPYYKMPMRNSGGEFLVHDIIVGPCSYQHQALSAAKSFLVSNGFRHLSVRKTSVPLRSI